MSQSPTVLSNQPCFAVKCSTIKSAMYWLTCTWTEISLYSSPFSHHLHFQAGQTCIVLSLLKTDGSKIEHELMSLDMILTGSRSLQLIVFPVDWARNLGLILKSFHPSPFSLPSDQIHHSPLLQTPPETTSTNRAPLQTVLEFSPKLQYPHLTEACMAPLFHSHGHKEAMTGLPASLPCSHMAASTFK